MYYSYLRKSDLELRAQTAVSVNAKKMFTADDDLQRALDKWITIYKRVDFKFGTQAVYRQNEIVSLKNSEM